MKIYWSKDYLSTQLSSGKTYIDLAKKHNVDPCTIQRQLTKYRLTKKRIGWIKEELELLKKNYNHKDEIYKLFPKRTISSIYHKASRLKLKRFYRKRTYAVNKDFFNKWSDEMAYVLGWFFSDGTVSKDLRNCNIHIHKNDSYILKNIRDIMGSDCKIYFYKNSACLNIFSKYLCRSLVKLGCIPNKSLKLTFPEIPKRHLSHFIRGYFDGDGSIYFSKPNSIKVAFIGTKAFIEDLRDKLNEVIGVKTNCLRKHFKIYIITYFGDNARKVCYWMYRDCETLYLKRKKKRFDNHLIRRKVNGKL